MRLTRSLAAALAIGLTLTACQSITGADRESTDIAGMWEVRTLQPPGATIETLYFGEDGRFYHTLVWLTRYPQQSGADATMHRTIGTYTQAGAHVTFAPDSQFYTNGATGENTARKWVLLPWGDFFKDARVGVANDRLTIRYTGIGPSDGPEPASRTFARKPYEW